MIFVPTAGVGWIFSTHGATIIICSHGGTDGTRLLSFVDDGFFPQKKNVNTEKTPQENEHLPSLRAQLLIGFVTSTPRKINIEPENDGLEDEFPFPGVYSQLPC